MIIHAQLATTYLSFGLTFQTLQQMKLKECSKNLQMVYNSIIKIGHQVNLWVIKLRRRRSNEVAIIRPYIYFAWLTSFH